MENTQSNTKAEKSPLLKWNSLFFRMFILSSLVSLIVIVIFTVITIPRQYKSIIRIMETRAQSIANSIALVCGDAIVSGDNGFVVEHNLEVLRNNTDILYSAFVFENGVTLLHLPNKWKQLDRPDPEWDKASGKAERGRIQHSNLLGHEIFQYVFPVTYGGMTHGSIYLGFSLDYLKKELSTSYKVTFLLSLFCFIVGGAGFYLLARQMTRPIISLSEVTKRIADGELSARVELIPKDEIGELSVSFNKMVDDLQRRTEELGKTNIELERQIELGEKMEEELLQARKLESLAVLAGGVAHDFNNLLTGIVGNVSLLKIYLPRDDKNYARLLSLENAVFQARGLTQQLLTFSKGGLPVKETASIKEIIMASAAFTLSGSNVRYDFSPQENLWNVEADVGQLSQVMNNLLINAWQSMPDGGTIVVKCQNIILNKNDFLLEEGKYIMISVQDQGVGIPPENLQRIFDPYFTTKEKGSGLGLASAYSIIKKHQGHITVTSELGKGTTFTVFLPALEEESAAEKHQDKDVILGTGKLLVMDDDEIVRQVLREMLISLGYQVEFSEDGAVAIELYKRAMESEMPFDLVIMDLTIPGGIGGKEAIKKLAAIDPHVRAIVSSGYSNDPVMANYKEYGFRGVIQKPYSIDELSRVVSVVMKLDN